MLHIWHLMKSRQHSTFMWIVQIAVKLLIYRFISKLTWPKLGFTIHHLKKSKRDYFLMLHICHLMKSRRHSTFMWIVQMAVELLIYWFISKLTWPKLGFTPATDIISHFCEVIRVFVKRSLFTMRWLISLSYLWRLFWRMSHRWKTK